MFTLLNYVSLTIDLRDFCSIFPCQVVTLKSILSIKFPNKFSTNFIDSGAIESWVNLAKTEQYTCSIIVSMLITTILGLFFFRLRFQTVVIVDKISYWMIWLLCLWGARLRVPSCYTLELLQWRLNLDRLGVVRVRAKGSALLDRNACYGVLSLDNSAKPTHG